MNTFSSTIPELFYDLIGIFIPGGYLFGSIYVALQLREITVGVDFGATGNTFGILLAMYVLGHVVYSLGSITTAKLFAFLLGQPSGFLLSSTPPRRGHAFLHKMLFIGTPIDNSFLRKSVTQSIQRVCTLSNSTDIVSKDPYLAYEIARNYIMEHSRNRAAFIRKEQAYGEMARGIVTSSVICIVLIGLLRPSFWVWQLATHSVACVGFTFRYAQARFISPYYIYLNFGLRQSPAEADGEKTDLRQ